MRRGNEAENRLSPFVFVGAIAVFAVLMGFSGLYGFHRDELYFLDCARHLQASYVDQPVFTPLLARVSLWLFGVSLPGLRLWPALAAAATVVVGGLLAREFGGGPRSQVLAAAGAATAPAVLGADHLFGPTAFDLLAWAALALVVARIGRTGNTRLWVPAGALLGVGLANKHSIGFFALALVLGTVLSGGAGLLRNRWALLGLVVALACTVPDLWWQAGNGWPTISMTRRLAEENGGLANALSFLPAQLVMASPALLLVWIGGLRRLWRSHSPLWRSMAWAYGMLFVFFAATTGAKPYYLAGLYIPLLAAGAVRFEERLPRRATTPALLPVGLAVSVAATIPFVLPVLPATDLGFVTRVNPVEAEMVGWPELDATVARAWRAIPAAARRRTVIYTFDYGEAGAINELGPRRLPPAVSGHNTEWWWGPGLRDPEIVLAVAPGPVDGTGFEQSLQGIFTTVTPVATLANDAHIANQEAGGHVYLCRGPRRPWTTLWPDLRHYD